MKRGLTYGVRVTMLLCFCIVTLNAYAQFVPEVDDDSTEVKAEVIVAPNLPPVPDELIQDRLQCLEGRVQLTYNKRIRSFIDYFTVRNRNYTLVMERRQRLYFPIFEEILAKHGVPQEIKYLAVVESGLNPNAISPAGAAGLWQFMPATGRSFGLYIDEYVDERFDPYKSTEAACKYLKQLYGAFSDWELAMAAYNCGPGNVRRAIRRSGYKDNFWDVYNNLPRETRGYVPQYVALTYAMNHFEDHLIFADSIQYPMKFDTVQFHKQFVNLEVLCESLNICMDDLKRLNPSLKKNVIPDHLSYTLRLPVDAMIPFMADRLAIVDLCSERREGDVKVMVADRPVTVKPAATASTQKYKVIHTVKSGDVLGKIADKHHVTVSQLKSWNGLTGNTIRVGQKLVVYQSKPPASNSHSNSSVASTEAPKYYYVQPGDTLWTISQKYKGLTVDKIKQLNNLRDANIKPGQKLIIS
jgi:membrane-bound lytic murein transglycosylase D